VTDFAALRQAVVASYQPANAEKAPLTDQVAQALWRFNRAQRIESPYLRFGQTESQQILTAQGINRRSTSDVTELQGDSLTTDLVMRENGYSAISRRSSDPTSRRNTPRRSAGSCPRPRCQALCRRK
jgi:hypothetical protein